MKENGDSARQQTIKNWLRTERRSRSRPRRCSHGVPEKRGKNIPWGVDKFSPWVSEKMGRNDGRSLTNCVELSNEMRCSLWEHFTLEPWSYQ